MAFWYSNRLLALGYRGYTCEWCSSKIWKVGFIVGFLDNTIAGFCPNCPNYVDE
jgi:hypothetical protein